MATPIEEPQLKTKKPSNSAFKQQRLPAWQPILTAGTVLPTFFVIGLAFIPIGIGLLVSSNEVKERQIDYTSCNSTNHSNYTCDVYLKDFPNETCYCKVNFTLHESYKEQVYMYYGLTNYYQNHRRYVKSRSDQQLLGKNLPITSLSECEPFSSGKAPDGRILPIAPCGAIANSLFNDTLVLKYKENNDWVIVPLVKTGITWPTDSVKYVNPPNGDFSNTVKPPNWQSEKQNYTDEDLIVWMRTAALPTFRKLYRRIDHNQAGYKNNLPKGEYQLEVTYQYPVISFQGTKRMILSNTSWLGGRNPFLGIAYIVVGTICLLLAFVFLVIHNKFGRRRYGWQSTPSSSGDSESTRLRTPATLD